MSWIGTWQFQLFLAFVNLFCVWSNARVYVRTGWRGAKYAAYFSAVVVVWCVAVALKFWRQS